jgi:hypothetical protein
LFSVLVLALALAMAMAYGVVVLEVHCSVLGFGNVAFTTIFLEKPKSTNKKEKKTKTKKIKEGRWLVSLMFF